MSGKENIAAIIKVEQLNLFKETLGISYRESSEMFDQYGVWGFIDDAYEGFHIQGAPATFDEINAYINRCKETETQFQDLTFSKPMRWSRNERKI